MKSGLLAAVFRAMMVFFTFTVLLALSMPPPLPVVELPEMVLLVTLAVRELKMPPPPPLPVAMLRKMVELVTVIVPLTVPEL